MTSVSTWMPSCANTSASSRLDSGSSGPRMRSPTSRTVTLTPKRASAWASSAPIGPPPMTASEPGTDSIRRMSRLVQYGVSASPSIGGAEGEVPGLSTTPRAASKTSPSTSTVRGPVSRAWPRTNAHARLLEPVDGHLVVPVVGRLVPDPVGDLAPVGAYVGLAREPRNPPCLGEHVGRADDHLARDAAVVGALTPHEPLVDPDDGETGLRQLGRRRLPTWAESDHHHVTRSHHAGSLAPASTARTAPWAQGGVSRRRRW